MVLQACQSPSYPRLPLPFVLNVASSGSYIFMGGLLQLIGGVLEFFLGNTFSFVLFSAFGKATSTRPVIRRSLS